MPRKQKKSKGVSKKELAEIKNARIHQFLPCFFDVPVAEVQEILSVSHHTIDPLRRRLGLQKWPFLEVIHDKFCMSAEEICELRRSMMVIADEAMQAVLKKIEEKAIECRYLLEYRTRLRTIQLSARRKRLTKKKTVIIREASTEQLTQHLDCSKQLVMAHAFQAIDNAPSVLSDAELQALIDDAAITGDGQFWNEVSQLLCSSPLPGAGVEPPPPAPAVF